MRFYSETEMAEAKKRIGELREMEELNYENMPLARKVELSVIEAQLGRIE